MKIKLFTFNKNHSYRWLLTVAIVFFIVSFLSALVLFIFNIYYDGKVMPGIYFDKTNLGGLTEVEAKKIISDKVENINKNGYEFLYAKQRTTVLPIISSDSSDLAFEIINFDIDQTVNNIYNAGRNSSAFNNFLNGVDYIFSPKIFYLNYQTNDEAIKGVLADTFFQYNEPAKNAELTYDREKGFDITSEQYGQTLDFEVGLEEMKKYLNHGETGIVNLISKKSEPTIFKNDCQNASAEAETILSKAPIKLTYLEKSWLINGDILASWLSLKKIDENNTSKVVVGIDINKTSAYLNNTIANKINIAPKDSKFKIVGDKVEEFQISENGLFFDATSSAEKIITEITEKQNQQIELIVGPAKSTIGQSEINNLSIREIIGTGESNFAGSPKNRRHNIAVGANAVNGTLIKPGEEFSLLHTLGKVDASTGYLQELVIKENKTIPEYGGGLCQIGTTMFRTAIASGLPITMRRNHSYRVTYYEPAGTDATIYDPAPDFRFINDTGNYILIQSRFAGTKIYFDFWGVKDGRIVENTKSTIYNIVKPEPTKITETTDLAPGEKKCTEKAHNGADAYFDYKVTYPNGEIKQKRFSSHYVPWQEVCLMGVDKLSATSTPEVIIRNPDSGPPVTKSTSTIIDIPIPTKLNN